MSFCFLLISTALMYSSPLVFGAMAGVISERSGVINIGIEGMMTVGAFAASAAAYFAGSPCLGLLIGGISAMLLSLLHAVASIHCHCDQTISGIALNLIGPGVALFLCGLMFDGSKITPTTATLPKLFDVLHINISGSNPFYQLNVNIMVIIAIIVVVLMWYFLYKTKWGLRLRCIGEHPATAATLGIDVYKNRYFAVLTSGFIAGLGGAAMTLSVVSQFSSTVISGQGYIALAAVIFGKWKPLGAYVACLLFGLFQAFSIVLPGTLPINIPSEFLSMLPYILTIIILILFVGKAVAPKADGVPYRKGIRYIK